MLLLFTSAALLLFTTAARFLSPFLPTLFYFGCLISFVTLQFHFPAVLQHQVSVRVLPTLPLPHSPTPAARCLDLHL